MMASQARAAYGGLPLSFEVNHGQTDTVVNFLSRGPGYTLFLTLSEAVFVLGGTGAAPESPAVLRMKLEGANGQAAGSGEDRLEGNVNYFIGKDPQKWRTDIPTFARVRYGSVYEGVHLVYYGNQQQLEYDFIVRPGGDHRRIVLGLNDSVRVEVESATGDLLLHLGEETLRQRKPVVYQEVDGQRREIGSGYEMRGLNLVGFAVGSYDPLKPLVIDPVLVYSTYLGGSSAESANAITVDTSGQVYFAAGVNSTNFPLTPGAFDTTSVGGQETVVAKINAGGTGLLYSTYLGGNALEVGSGIAVDPAGNAYVAGSQGINRG